jgi:hypothetical protein
MQLVSGLGSLQSPLAEVCVRRKILVSLIVLCAFSPELVAQGSSPDTTKAPPPTVQSDSAKAAIEAKQAAAHRRKILWWTGGIALFIVLNLLISDRPSSR